MRSEKRGGSKLEESRSLLMILFGHHLKTDRQLKLASNIKYVMFYVRCL